MPVICRTFLLKLALRTLSQEQLTVPTIFDYNHLAQVKLLWKMRKFICYCTVFALFYFEIEGNFQPQAPGGLYLEGRFN